MANDKPFDYTSILGHDLTKAEEQVFGAMVRTTKRADHKLELAKNVLAQSNPTWSSIDELTDATALHNTTRLLAYRLTVKDSTTTLELHNTARLVLDDAIANVRLQQSLSTSPASNAMRAAELNSYRDLIAAAEGWLQILQCSLQRGERHEPGSLVVDPTTGTIIQEG